MANCLRLVLVWSVVEHFVVDRRRIVQIQHPSQGLSNVVDHLLVLGVQVPQRDRVEVVPDGEHASVDLITDQKLFAYQSSAGERNGVN